MRFISNFIKIAIGLAAIIVGLIAWYKISYPAYTYRYRLMIEAVIDGQLKFGNSVIEVQLQTQPMIGNAPPAVPHVRGEATFLDLGSNRNLFAILAAGPIAADVAYPFNLVPQLFRVPHGSREMANIEALRGMREIPSNYLPTLVTFSDINKPSSARVVTPEDFSAIFGEGAHLKRVVVELTRDPVEQKIERDFPRLIADLKAQTFIPAMIRQNYYTPQFSQFIRQD